MASETTFLYRIDIKTTPEQLWSALVDGNQSSKYFSMGLSVRNIDKPGADYEYVLPDGTNMLGGKVLEVDPPRKLVLTFVPHWIDTPHESKVTYEITEEGGVCQLLLRHENLVEGDPLTEGVKGGWARIFSSLKSLLETGSALPPEQM